MEYIKKIYSNVSGKRLKILEKSGKNQGIPCGKKCRYPELCAKDVSFGDLNHL